MIQVKSRLAIMTQNSFTIDFCLLIKAAVATGTKAKIKK